MIRKLRIRFIVITMGALILVLLTIMSLINIFNYYSVISEAEQILSILEANDGTFPKKGNTDDLPQKSTAPQPSGPDNKRFSPELPYESRYFSVVLSSDGNVVSVDTGKIAAIDTDTAIEFAEKVFNSNRENGFLGNYRFKNSVTQNQDTRIIFLDCTKSLSTFRNFLITSGAISLMGLLSVFILIFFFSKRIIRPFLESYEKQKRFITDAGHELKTPLTIINADIELLEMDNESNEWLEDIRAQTRRLTNLTNDLILLSKMEEDHPPVTMIDFPFSDMVEETAQSFQAVAKTRGKKFEMNIEPMISLHGDEKALRQLVTILLDNALKYSDEHGEIIIGLKKQKKSVCLNVQNSTDCPLPKQLDTLFERFYRADTSRSSANKGYGLGLSIARKIVYTHRGKISVSKDGEKLLKICIVFPGFPDK